MIKILFIFFLAIVMFLVEFFLFNLLDTGFLPNLSLLLLVFVSVSCDIRLSMFVALVSGILKDSFSHAVVGINLISFPMLVLLSLVLLKYIHYSESRRAKLLMVFIIVVANFLIQYFTRIMVISTNFFEAFWHVLVPECVATLILALFILKELKKCVLRLSV